MSLLIGTSCNAQGQSSDEAFTARYERLAHELRCLVCQNQTLGESGSDLAQDLKAEVKAMIAAGKSDAEIKTYLQARYGDFILYKPPVQNNTYLLWLGPFAALIGGGVIAATVLRRRSRKSLQTTLAAATNTSSLTDDERRELEDRLK